MLITLLIIPFITLVLLLYENENFRQSILLAAIILGTVITIITEFLSLLNHLNLFALSLSWLFVNLGLSFLYYCKIQNRNKLPKFQFPDLPTYLWILLGGVAAIAFFTALIALIAPPNTWDSMTYHMPRVMHWMQNKSVTHYPTSNLRQLYQPPWSEFAILHLQILSGGDRFANLVQWCSMIGSLLGISLITRELQGNIVTQGLAIIFAATLPMGILQASSTQNDYACTFWLVCLAYLTLISVKNKLTFNLSFYIGMSFGLLILTKGTGYIFSSSFLLWILLNNKIKSWDLRFFIIILIAFLINIGHYQRNFLLFNNFLATGDENYKNEVLTLSTLSSNIFRNLAIHLSLPLIDNNWIIELSKHIHKILGLDESDPRITWAGTNFTIFTASTFESTANNPFHFYIIILSLILFFCFFRKFKANKILLKYAIALSIAVILFCVLLKFQIWNSRLHLPIFVLFSPFVAKVFSDCTGKRLRIYTSIFLIIISFYWVFFNETRPLLSNYSILKETRQETYFHSRIDLKSDYLEATNILNQLNCSQIALILGSDDWEYPLLVLNKKRKQPRLIKHIKVNNISKNIIDSSSNKEFTPCAILQLDKNGSDILTLEYGKYKKYWVGEGLKKSLAGRLLQIYVREDSELFR
jgi:hypothetical protein